jgi:hypothetical protein
MLEIFLFLLQINYNEFNLKIYTQVKYDGKNIVNFFRFLIKKFSSYV